MQDYTYKNQELEYARFLRVFTPNKIWWDFIAYYFDYGDFYFKLETLSEIADSQNGETEEAIIGKFTKHSEPIPLSVGAKLVCENKRIEQLYIVRTLLYFTDYKTYSKTQIQFNKIKAQIKNLFKPDPINQLAGGIIGGNMELTTNPESETVKKLNPQYTNLIDCGLLLQIEGELLKAYVAGNGFGFHVFENKFFFTAEEFKETAKGIQLIKV